MFCSIHRFVTLALVTVASLLLALPESALAQSEPTRKPVDCGSFMVSAGPSQLGPQRNATAIWTLPSGCGGTFNMPVVQNREVLSEVPDKCGEPETHVHEIIIPPGPPQSFQVTGSS